MRGLKYIDRIVFKYVSAKFHSAYRLIRSGTNDAERCAMFRRAAFWLAVNKVEGVVLEFGCGNGDSFLAMAPHFKEFFPEGIRFCLFDSFEGLPESSRYDEGWIRGTYKYSLGYLFEKIIFYWSENYTLIKGNFKDQPKFLDPCLLIHIDCDLYESTKDALALCTPQNGTVVMFDDYYRNKGHPGMGEARAFKEWLSETEWRAVPWYDYAITGKAFILTQ